MLRRRSSGVAEHSQHIQGRAMDMHYTDVSMSKVREIAMRLQRGGVGYYPTSGTPFVHLDVGSVRAWPRMSYQELARIFPDGKTVHLPTNGQPMARYDDARAEIEARGDSSIQVASADIPRKSRGFFERLFGIGDDDEDAGAVITPRARTRVARVTTQDKNDAGAIETPAQRRAQGIIARAERNLPKGETTIGTPVQVAAIDVLPPRFRQNHRSQRFDAVKSVAAQRLQAVEPLGKELGQLRLRTVNAEASVEGPELFGAEVDRIGPQAFRG
jgi:hypothetical protein